MADSDSAAAVIDGVSLDQLADRLGKKAATEFFERVDGSLRNGNVIHATNVRGSRTVFSKARHQGQAQLVVNGRGVGAVGDSVVIIKMDDLEAVVRAGREPFSWAKTFAPRSGLRPATSSPSIVRGARGRRQLIG